MNTRKILIADKSIFFLELVKSFLKKAGCQVLSTCNGQDVLKIVDELCPDLIIMDLDLPTLSGEECCKRLKANVDAKDIPIIITVARGNERDMKKAVAAGCDDYVSKPVDKIDLLRKIKQLIDLVAREEARFPIYSKLTYDDGKKVYDGEAYFISRGGMFINGPNLLPVGSSLSLRFSISSAEELIEAEGKVAWKTENEETIPAHVTTGMGISFVHISDEGKEAIEAYISQGNYLI
ncbi:MAG: response regulator [Proteobacteria bacterium]|nr:response regulator [Pseudomonadota bacterium]